MFYRLELKKLILYISQGFEGEKVEGFGWKLLAVIKYFKTL